MNLCKNLSEEKIQSHIPFVSKFKTSAIQVVFLLEDSSIDNVWNDVEKFIQFGDICMFRPDIPHRVDPIDAGIELDWNTISGRWTIFSPIANISNEDINEIEVKS